MAIQSQMRSSILAALVLALTLVSAGPCDIYAHGGTPCVAAHSTTRALFSAYKGPLYQVQKGSDGSSTKDIYPLEAGGVANAKTQDDFCGKTTCHITNIYDQSGHGNHLTRAQAGPLHKGPQPNGSDDLAVANAAPIKVNGHKAYGVYIHPGSGYRNDNTKGVAKNDEAEGLYNVVDGTHYNDKCCFDYGNAENNNADTGAGRMEAIYFGSAQSSDGPHILADLENGLYSRSEPGLNPEEPVQKSRFVHANLKGKPGYWSIRGGSATEGSLRTYFNGSRPAGYNPMRKQGAVILDIGGDNSNGAEGTFYEGVLTSGYPSDATEDSVQKEIVAAKYST